jgi:hypothetical protein
MQEAALVAHFTCSKLVVSTSSIELIVIHHARLQHRLTKEKFNYAFLSARKM